MVVQIVNARNTTHVIFSRVCGQLEVVVLFAFFYLSDVFNPVYVLFEKGYNNIEINTVQTCSRVDGNAWRWVWGLCFCGEVACVFGCLVGVFVLSSGCCLVVVVPLVLVHGGGFVLVQYGLCGLFWFKDAYSGTTDVDWSFNGRQGQTVAVGSLGVGCWFRV
jgi:hypothetical protein